MEEHFGEIAALGTALCWAMTALLFADAGARIGSLVVNFIRLVMALVMLSLLGLALRGQAWPADATAHAWGWLSLSGLVGFAFGDLCLFRAFVVIGPRLSALLMSMAPPMTAIIGWLLLAETLDGVQMLGMTLTVGGVGWAALERQPRGDAEPRSRRAQVKGVLLGLGGALGQAGGLVLSKYGMGDYDAFAATQIRVLAGVLGFAVLFTALRRWPRAGRAVRQPRAMLSTFLGAIFGPFLGVSLSLLAVQRTNAGVAASLMATSPILIIPLVVVVRRERVAAGGVLGAVLAVLGVVLLVR